MSDNGQNPELRCSLCGACCRFFAIERPIGKDERPVGAILFYSFHEGINSFVREDDEGNRFLHVTIYARCSMLQEHNDGTTSCKIYQNRPPICRNFPLRLGSGTTRDLPDCTMLKASAIEATVEARR